LCSQFVTWDHTRRYFNLKDFFLAGNFPLSTVSAWYRLDTVLVAITFISAVTRFDCGVFFILRQTTRGGGTSECYLQYITCRLCFVISGMPNRNRTGLAGDDTEPSIRREEQTVQFFCFVFVLFFLPSINFKMILTSDRGVFFFLFFLFRYPFLMQITFLC